MPDDRLAVIVDRIPRSGESSADRAENVVCFSSDNGQTWSAPQTLPLKGIVPDKYRMLNNGRIAIAAHHLHEGKLTEFLRYSDDGGKTWSDPVTIAHDPRYHLCEVCLIPLGENKVAALLRENSGLGYDCLKCVSHDNGETWGELVNFPLPGCHRPVAAPLKDGRFLITYRFHHGAGRCGMGSGAQNFFGAVTDRESLLADTRSMAAVTIFPIDHDRAQRADTGYSGWVQLPDNSVYVVNYIVDDAVSKGQIRGYRFDPDSLFIAEKPRRCCSCSCSKENCKWQ
jgi:sialidase-1